jgi:hypothetical protein
MSEANGSNEIIIKGGSVEVQFDSAGYTRNGNKHDNPDKKITQIVVVDENGVEKCNSGNTPGGLKWTVTVTTR